MAQLEDLWCRAVADLDNQRKRAVRDVERLRAEERDRVAAQWLPVLDTSASRPVVVDGQRIRLAGQGGQGGDGAPVGDLCLVVRIAPHQRYRVEGRDVYVDLPLAPWEAALGTTVALDTPGPEGQAKAACRRPGGRVGAGATEGAMDARQLHPTIGHAAGAAGVTRPARHQPAVPHDLEHAEPQVEAAHSTWQSLLGR